MKYQTRFYKQKLTQKIAKLNGIAYSDIHQYKKVQ